MRRASPKPARRGILATLPDYTRLARRTTLPPAWRERLIRILATPEGFQLYSGRVRKMCEFEADIAVHFHDARGPVDLSFCFGCQDLLLPGRKFRDFTPVAGDLLELAVEAFPADSLLAQRLREHQAGRSLS